MESAKLFSTFALLALLMAYLNYRPVPLKKIPVLTGNELVATTYFEEIPFSSIEMDEAKNVASPTSQLCGNKNSSEPGKDSVTPLHCLVGADDFEFNN